MSTTANARPKIVAPGAGRQVTIGPNAVTFKLQSPDLSVVEYVAAPGTRPPTDGLMRHTRESSTVYVLEGELTYRFEDEEVTAPAGTLVHLARGAWFSWRNDGDRPARFLVMFTPAGFEQIFTELTEALQDTDPTPDTIATLVADRHAAYGMQKRPPTA